MTKLGNYDREAKIIYSILITLLAVKHKDQMFREHLLANFKDCLNDKNLSIDKLIDTFCKFFQHNSDSAESLKV